MEEDFLRKFAEVLEHEGLVGLDDQFREYGNWNSLLFLETISFIEDDYGVLISAEEFRKIKTVRELIQYIEACKK